MQVLDLLLQDNRTSLPRFALTAGLAGLANAGVLVIVNFAARTHYGSGPDVYLLAVFLLAIVVFAVAQRRTYRMATHAVEAMVERTRTRLLGRIRQCELLSLEAVGTARIQSAMTTEAHSLSQAMNQVVTGVQSCLVTLCTGIYIAYLSWTAFALWIASVAIAAAIFMRKWQESQRQLMAATMRDTEFQELVASLLLGFKEIKLWRRRAEAVFGEAHGAAETVREAKVASQDGMNTSYVLAQVLFFMLVGTMVFLVPAFGQIDRDTLTQVTTAVLFVLGPVSSIIASVPALAMAEAAAQSLSGLEHALDAQVAAENGLALPARAGRFAPFATLDLAGVTFRYPQAAGGEGFALGPIDLTIRAGETIFLTGGNGAGKSTFLRLLTGLYRPDGGVIRVNGVAVEPGNVQDYRDLIAAVFSDYFLFRKLYGLEVDPAEAAGWLAEMELQDKTQLEGGAFTTIQLSSGQRKRLALLAAALEAKPILVLDEWAADQDPVFRRKFYEVILPALQRRGVTVIAATHDDRWFHLADREIRLAEGRIQVEPKG